MRATLSLSRAHGRFWAALHEDGRVVELRPSPADDEPAPERIIRARVLRMHASPRGAIVDLGGGWEGWLPDPDLAPRPGEALAVQVTGPPRRGKRATVSDRLELSGRFLVLLPGVERRTVSRRVRDPAARDRLERLLAELPPGPGFVVRTAGVAAGEPELRREAARLVERWNGVSGRLLATAPPAVVLREPAPLVRALRDGPARDVVDEIVVDDPADRQAALTYLGDQEPALVSRLRLVLPPGVLWESGGLGVAVEEALARHVPLPSGGRLTLDPTEALLSIDVDSGAGEDAVRQADREAALEIPRQLRLRGVGGIVVVDWIGFTDRAHREQVLESFAAQLRRDRGRVRIVDVSEIGLLQLTRERAGHSLEALLTRPCTGCAGAGRQRLMG